MAGSVFDRYLRHQNKDTLNLIQGFRNPQRSARRRVALVFWAVSSLNLFISPAFTIPEGNLPGIHAAASPHASLLETLLCWVYAAVNPNADLADGVEDSIDKTEYITSTHGMLAAITPDRGMKFAPPRDFLSHTFLEKFTPPPRKS